MLQHDIVTENAYDFLNFLMVHPGRMTVCALEYQRCFALLDLKVNELRTKYYCRHL